MRPLKVLQLLPALDSGGVERGTLEIARALVAAGHESVVLSKGGRLVEQLQREGSRHLARDLGRKSPATFLHYRALRKLLEARSKLSDLRNKLAGNDKLEDILGEVLSNTEKLQQLGGEAQSKE